MRTHNIHVRIKCESVFTRLFTDEYILTQLSLGLCDLIVKVTWRRKVEEFIWNTLIQCLLILGLHFKDDFGDWVDFWKIKPISGGLGAGPHLEEVVACFQEPLLIWGSTQHAESRRRLLFFFLFYMYQSKNWLSKSVLSTIMLIKLDKIFPMY